MVFVYTTCRDIDEAKKISRLLVEQRLASCCNFWQINSVYSWEGAIKDDQETALLVKTLEIKLPDIENLILSNHSYSVPIIAAIDVKRINRAYKEWMVRCID